MTSKITDIIKAVQEEFPGAIISLTGVSTNHPLLWLTNRDVERVVRLYLDEIEVDDIIDDVLRSLYSDTSIFMGRNI